MNPSHFMWLMVWFMMLSARTVVKKFFWYFIDISEEVFYEVILLSKLQVLSPITQNLITSQFSQCSLHVVKVARSACEFKLFDHLKTWKLLHLSLKQITMGEQIASCKILLVVALGTLCFDELQIDGTWCLEPYCTLGLLLLHID